MAERPLFEAHGKQVKRTSGGILNEHYADACSEIAAGTIAAALNEYVARNKQ
jgi:hypothetical protein